MATAAVLAAVRGRTRYGLDIIESTGLLAGTVYTTLRRIEKKGLVEGTWEDPEIAEAERRPRRRYYSITPEGEAALDAAADRINAVFGRLDPATGKVDT